MQRNKVYTNRKSCYYKMWATVKEDMLSRNKSLDPSNSIGEIRFTNKKDS